MPSLYLFQSSILLIIIKGFETLLVTLILGAPDIEFSRLDVFILIQIITKGHLQGHYVLPTC